MDCPFMLLGGSDGVFCLVTTKYVEKAIQAEKGSSVGQRVEITRQRLHLLN